MEITMEFYESVKKGSSFRSLFRQPAVSLLFVFIIIQLFLFRAADAATASFVGKTYTDDITIKGRSVLSYIKISGPTQVNEYSGASKNSN